MDKFLKKALGLFKKISFFPATLAFICLTVITTSFVPGSWLSGWDTLHPEFDFLLNLKRLFFGVFRTEQGLGAVAAHAHMSDLPRVLLLWFSSLVIPTNFLRFFYIVLCLPVGVLGVYYFVKNIILDQIEKKKAEALAFLGGLFYLFNLGTLQHFYVPFEMFTTAYAFIPWLFWSASNFLKQNTKKNLIWFGLINLLAAPMAYAPLLWYAYFLCLGLFLIPFFFGKFKQALTLLVIATSVNLFWILPNLYFLFSGNAYLVPDARINKIFSDEAFLFNKSYGNIKDALVFKNFLFDWPVYSGNSFEYLMGVWRNYIANPFILGLGYLFSLISVLGIIKTLLDSKKKLTNKFLFSLLAPMVVCAIFIVNASQPFDLLFSFLRDNISIFREAFRFPFTKFSIFLMFGMSVFFAVGSYFLYSLFAKVSRYNKYFLPLQVIVSVILFFVYMFPIFNGNLISSRMFVKIPSEYFQTFEYFKTQDENTRISVLPAQSFWGWIYYDFGFQGAQFITFGIKQPVLDRDWDRWNPLNEQYYREFSYAVYSQNPMLLQKVMDKYSVGFLIFDGNIIAPDANNEENNLYKHQIELLIRNSDFLTLDAKFNNISIYKYHRVQALIDSKNSYSYIEENSLVKDVDFAYLNQGDYIQTKYSKGISYPLIQTTDNLNLFTQNNLEINDSNISLKFDNLKKNINVSLADYINAESVVPARVYTKILGNDLNIKISLVLPQIGEAEEVKLEYSTPIDQITDLKNGAVLNIDKYQALTLKNLETAEYVEQGSILLSTSVYTNLSLVDASSFVKSNREVSDIVSINPGVESDYSLNLCNKADADQVFSMGVTDGNGIKIAGKNSKACLWIPLNKILSAQEVEAFKSLVRFSFNTKSNAEVIGRYCIFDKSLERCVKSSKYIINSSNLVEYFNAAPEDLDRYELVLYLDGVNNKKLEEIEYSNLEISSAKPFYLFTLTPEDLKEAVEEKTLSFDSKTKLDLSTLQSSLVEKFNLLEVGHEKSDCSNIITKDYDRNINKQNGYIEYRSEKGSSCDFFSFPNLDHNLGYLLVVDSKNQEGLPLRVCVANPYSKRCDVYLSLPYNKEFGKNVMLIPPLTDGGVGYDIHFDNYAVGEIASVNQVKDLQIIPFPYYFLQSQFTNEEEIDGTITLLNKKIILPGFYRVEFVNNDGGLLVLNYAFENGWWMRGSSHVKVNGWANGWLVNEKAGSRIIIYWPQVLEFLGFGILFTIFFWFIKILRKKTI